MPSYLCVYMAANVFFPLLIPLTTDLENGKSPKISKSFITQHNGMTFLFLLLLLPTVYQLSSSDGLLIADGCNAVVKMYSA